VVVSVSVGANGVSVIDGARDARMPQAVIANSTMKPTASHVPSILPAFGLATVLFPHQA
jgi:hypothetical protein